LAQPRAILALVVCTTGVTPAAGWPWRQEGEEKRRGVCPHLI
jgi:hypothetical protein